MTMFYLNGFGIDPNYKMEGPFIRYDVPMSRTRYEIRYQGNGKYNLVVRERHSEKWYDTSEKWYDTVTNPPEDLAVALMNLVDLIKENLPLQDPNPKPEPKYFMILNIEQDEDHEWQMVKRCDQEYNFYSQFDSNPKFSDDELEILETWMKCAKPGESLDHPTLGCIICTGEFTKSKQMVAVPSTRYHIE